MGIRKLFFETASLLTLITLFVVTLNSYLVQRNATKDLKYLQRQYLNATFEIYRNELIGDVLVGNKQIISSLLVEITKDRGVGVKLSYDTIQLSTATVKPGLPVFSYNLNLGNEKFAKIVLFPLSNPKAFTVFNNLLVPLILEILILSLGFVWLLQRINSRLLNPLKELVIKLSSDALDKLSLKPIAVAELKQLAETLQKMTIDLKKKALYEAELKAAKQVAHDIRSPLACLNLMLSYTATLPEKQRILMRSSIQRITDIANVLQSRAKLNNQKIDYETGSEVTMMSSLLESLVTEKRMQLGFSANIRIDLDLDKCYGLFATVNTIEFKRAFSNLIDNSLEAFDSAPHLVSIAIDYDDSRIYFRLKDDGVGIRKEVLMRVGTYGFSYGKDGFKSGGCGLGVYHAMTTFASFGGTFHIDSEYGFGTEITISLPRVSPPIWFVPTIRLYSINLIVVLDDDDSIHHLWSEKFQESKFKYRYTIRNYKSISDFEAFVSQDSLNATNSVLYLVDYEFLNQNKCGLDIIEGLRIAKNSILVTSHCEDADIKARAIRMGVRIIPKSIVSSIPIE